MGEIPVADANLGLTLIQRDYEGQMSHCRWALIEGQIQRQTCIVFRSRMALEWRDYVEGSSWEPPFDSVYDTMTNRPYLPWD